MKQYKALLDQVLKGDVDQTSEACSLERGHLAATTDESLQRQLLSFRLALKAGNTHIPVENLREELTRDHFLKGEILFFKGSYYGQFHEPDQAISYFTKAQKAYASCQNTEKELLSEFNAQIGRSNLQESSIKSEIAIYQDLLKKAEAHSIGKVEFLCRRQLSYLHYAAKEFSVAIEILEKNLTNSNITRSDLDLAFVHLADCYLKNCDIRKAIIYYDKVSEICDERVLFPKALISAKIFQSPLQFKQFKYVSLYWQKRYIEFLEEKKQTLSSDFKKIKTTAAKWDQKSGILWQGNRKLGIIKPHSLVGQLIDLLSVAPRTKSYLCESLWPGELTSDYLDDRFHQLVLRTKRKVRGLIHFDGQFYRLNDEYAFYSPRNDKSIELYKRNAKSSFSAI